MTLFTKDPTLRAAALKAGFRSFEQTLTAGLGVGTLGGVTLGITTDATGHVTLATSWQVIVAAAVFLVLSAFFAGLRSYVSIATNGLPQQYIDAGIAAAQSAVSEGESKLAATPSITTVQQQVAATPEQAALQVVQALINEAHATVPASSAQSPSPATAPAGG